jgi:hypothetical protein
LVTNECGLALARSLSIPIAGYWGYSFQGVEVMYTSVFNPPSVIPAHLSGYTSTMNFYERVVNFILYIAHYLYMFEQVSFSEMHIKKRFPKQLPISKLIHNVDLTLVNSNFFVDCPRLFTPDVKYVGGLHLKTGKLSKVQK